MDEYITPEEAVANGVAALNERGPSDWATVIDVEKLDVRSGINCPLGQLFGDFGNQDSVDFVLYGTECDPDSDCGYDGCHCSASNDFVYNAALLGFIVNSHVFNTIRFTYAEIDAQLTAEWRRVLTEGVGAKAKRSWLRRVLKR